MEICHCFFSIVTDGSRDPLIVQILVSFPFEQALDHPSSHPKVQDFMHYSLWSVMMSGSDGGGASGKGSRA